MSPNEKKERYQQTIEHIRLLLGDSSDWIAAMATVACELHQAFNHYHWTGFYRTVRPDHLQVGPYQGAHGCIDIPFDRGVCGAAARTGTTQVVEDTALFPDHIACSASTQSEIVVPILSPTGQVIAVLDVDSDFRAAFDTVDRSALELLCDELGKRFGAEAERSIMP